MFFRISINRRTVLERDGLIKLTGLKSGFAVVCHAAYIVRPNPARVTGVIECCEAYAGFGASDLSGVVSVF